MNSTFSLMVFPWNCKQPTQLNFVFALLLSSTFASVFSFSMGIFQNICPNFMDDVVAESLSTAASRVRAVSRVSYSIKLCNLLLA